MMKVSVFKDIKANSCMQKELSEVLTSFSDSTYRERILSLRNFIQRGDKKNYDNYKRQLPAITFCGTFTGGHSGNDLVTYNKLLVIDIDHLSKDEFVRQCSCLKNDKYVFAVWMSPSGEGLKALVALEYPVMPDPSWVLCHKTAYSQFYNYLKEKYNIELDKSGSDVSRLCFVSYDPNLLVKEAEKFDVVINLEAQNTMKKINPPKHRIYSRAQINVKKDKLYNPSGKNNQKYRILISRIIHYLKKRKLSITSTYEEWYRVAYAIADSFTYEIGCKYFHKLCALDGGRYDKNNSDKILLYCYEHSMSQINFATIIYFAKLQGFKV